MEIHENSVKTIKLDEMPQNNFEIRHLDKLTIREQFALSAMNALIISGIYKDVNKSSDGIGTLCNHAYLFADEMIKQSK